MKLGAWRHGKQVEEEEEEEDGGRKEGKGSKGRQAKPTKNLEALTWQVRTIG